MSKLSIKVKITLWYTLIMAVISLTALFVMLSVSRNALIKEYTGKLIHAVDRMAEPKDDMRGLPPFMFFQDGVHIAIYDENNNSVNGFIPFEFMDNLSVKDKVVEENVYNGESFLVYGREVKNRAGNTIWIKGVVPISDRTDMLKDMSRINLILISILILTAALGGYMIIKKSFRPVSKITETAQRISEGNDLSQRISLGKGNDEIHYLADTFDKMLLKLEKTFEKEKQFTSDASHELRTPVAVINSECEYVLDCNLGVEEIKESVLSIKNQADKMSGLISELLEFSRMDSNVPLKNIEKIDISELLNFVCDEQEEVSKKNIKLIRNIASGISAVTSSVLLARIFMNLISNAYTYGKENGHIDVSLYKDKNNMVLKVSDDGIGISEDKLSKIWERFYRADSARTNNEGNIGLGLSMVKIISQRLGGDVSVKSTLGKGSEFTFVLPL